jgi:hypothetical protein
LKDRIKARVFPSVIVVALVLGAISGALVWLGKNDVRDPAEVTINGTVYSTALTDLSLKGLGLDDDDIAPLKYMTKLISLNLADNEITDLSALSGLTKLWYLNLNNNEIEDLDPLMEVSSLFIVLVLGNPVDSDQVAELRETLPHCLVLAF